MKFAVTLALPIVAITFSLLMRPFLTVRGVHPATGSVLAGAAFAAASYHVLKSQRARAASSKAVFIGLVVAQHFLLPRRQNLTSAAAFVLSVTLLFLYLQRIEQ